MRNVLFRMGVAIPSGAVDVYGHMDAGTSTLVRPYYGDSSGSALGVHLGLRGKLSRMYWAAEVGAERMTQDLAFTYLQIGLGIGWRFGPGVG